MISRTFKILAFIFLASHYCTAVCAQKKIQEIDSLLKVAYSITDIDSSNVLIEKLVREARANHYTLGIINALILKNVNLYNSGNFEDALKLNYNIEAEVVESKEYAKISHLYSLRANCYLNLLFFDKSTQWLNEAQHYAEKIKDNNKRYFSLGRIYRLRATNIRENTRVPINLDSAMYYTQKSYNIQRLITDNNSKVGLVIDSYNIGELFFEQGNIDSAKHYYFISRANAIKLNLLKFSLEAVTGLGSIHEKQNNIDSALFYFNAALKIALKAKRIGNIKKCYQHLTELYSKKGDNAKSKEYAYKFALITDSIANAHKKASTVTADYIIKDNESHYKRNKKQYIAGIIGAVIFLIILILALLKLRKNYRKTFLKQEKEHVELSKNLITYRWISLMRRF